MYFSEFPQENPARTARDSSPDLPPAPPESAFRPTALPEYLEGRTPKEKHPFLFQKKFHPRQIRNARSVFSFGVAGVLASAWGFLRIICFGNRFELGTINTPRQNSTAFSKPEGGTREARPTDFPPFFQTNSEFLARTCFSPRKRFEIRSNFD